MTAGKDVEFAPCTARGVTRDSVWTIAVTPAQRRSPCEGYTYASPDLAELECATVQVRTALEEMTVAAKAAVAGARAIVEVMDAAVAVLEVAERASAFDSTSDVATRLGSMLSPRERQVLALVAEGRSNKAIAEALFVSPNTIKTHIASLLNKLHADSRAQLAAIAARQGIYASDAPTLDDMETLAS
ncbi:MAG: response regulator transcription factor [Chloroflexi bacterium]|nr:response regulator transcription factor [Chloroflexota bacterium]